MLGFTFNNKHTSDMHVGFESQNRTIMPARRAKQYEIAGRNGLVDFGEGTYDMRSISVKIVIFGAENHSELRTLVRDVAYWLSGSGNLIFDDEPDKAYTAKVISEVSLEQLGSTGMSSVVFQCQPFAQRPNYAQEIKETVVNPFVITANSLGTQDTPVIIIIKNTGNLVINTIELQRKAVT